MRKLLITLGLLAGGALVTLTSTVNATTTPAPLCTGWYVNADELDRAPTAVATGLKFEGNDLVHHAANLPIASLTPGTYVATPAPDQPSFFSVEVRNPSGAYGTLRWNANAGMWQITIGPGAGATDGTFSGADPAALLAGKVTKWGAFGAGDTVVSFGVGYTNSPPGTVATVVSSVTFAGTSYSLACLPASSSSSASASASSSSSKPASASATATASASSSASATAPPTGSASASQTPLPVVPAGGNRLPTTGGKLIVVGAVGVGMVLLGVGALFMLKRRDDRFEA